MTTEPVAASAERTHPRIVIGSTVAGVDADALIAHHGSPLYVYDVTALHERVALLRQHMPAGVDIAYAVKANASPGVLSALLSAGVGADVASGGELRAVLRAGFSAGQVVFTGPGKTDAEIEAAFTAGIASLTIESLDELESVIALAPTAKPGQGLMFRLATTGDAEATPIIGGDGSAKFGMTDAEADEGIAQLTAAGLIGDEGPYRFRGVHAFGASNVLEAAALVAGIADLAHRAEALASRHGMEFEVIDGGGGLGIPYSAAEAPLDVDALGHGLTAELETWSQRPGLGQARLLLEPGRWLVGPVGAYLCSVVRTKRRGGAAIAITDGGIHHLLRPRLVGQDHRVVPAGRAASRVIDDTADIVGPLCTGIDLLARAVPAPTPMHGDIFAVLDVGAYGYAESMPFFLSHPIPAEIVVADGDVAVSRARIEPS